MADETPEMFAMTHAGPLGAFDVCLLCGALLAMGDGTKQVHRQFHERVDPAARGLGIHPETETPQ